MEVKRVSFRSILDDFASKWFGFDNRLGRTFLLMWTQPQQVVLPYLAGNRMQYVSPLSYLFIMTTLYMISFRLFGVEVAEILSIGSGALVQQDTISPQQEELQKILYQFMAQNYKIISVSSIPFNALVIGWFFRKRKLNYMERVVLSAYIGAQTLWISIVFVGIYAAFEYVGLYYQMFFSVVYFAFTMHKIMTQRSVVVSILKSIMVYALVFCMISLIGGAIGATYALATMTGQ